MSSLLLKSVLRATAVSAAAAVAFMAQAAPPDKPDQKADQGRKPDVEARSAQSSSPVGIVVPDNSVRQRVARSLVSGSTPPSSVPASAPADSTNATATVKPTATIRAPVVKGASGGSYISVPLNTNGPSEVPMSDGTLSVAVGDETTRTVETVYRNGDDNEQFGYGILVGPSNGRSCPHGAVCRVDRPARPVGAPSAPFGSLKSGPEIHREAQLTFSAAAEPHLRQFDTGFRNAQLEFHRATLDPGVPRGADGLRHEVTPSRGRPPMRPVPRPR